MTQQPHCDHEIVCWMYRENRIPQRKEPCNRNMAGVPSCISDTRRSRPAPAAEILKFPNSEQLLLMAHDEWKRREERRGIHEETPWVMGWISGYLTPKPDFKRAEQHDAAIRNETLDALRRFIEKNQCDGSCPFDSMNEGNCNEYETCDLCVYDHAANSLRSTPTAQEEPK